MTRRVEGLVWARKLAGRPNVLPGQRIGARSAPKQAGIRYENALAKAIPGARQGLWWEYQDAHRHGFAQTDLVLDLGPAVPLIVLEAKLTWTRAGHDQVDWLYRPILRVALGRPVVGFVVSKVLTAETPSAWICHDLADALERVCAGRTTVLQWLGNVPLGPTADAGEARPIDAQATSL